MAANVTKGVTGTESFGPCNPEQDLLFSVNPGVPSIDALETAACFLDDALEAMSRSEHQCFAAVRCIDLAKALVLAVVDGSMKPQTAKGGAA